MPPIETFMTFLPALTLLDISTGPDMMLDSVVFEIVAEAEIAQHLEEGVVTRSVTDVFQVVMFTARTHAALRGGCAGIITLVEAKENILELVHPGVGKQ
jgi:hypothetical protein